MADERLSADERQAYLDLGVPAEVLDADPAVMVAALRDGTPSHEVIKAALRKRALTFLMPTTYESWLDGYNQTLGSRPRDVLSLKQYARVFDALAVEEQRVWGG